MIGWLPHTCQTTGTKLYRDTIEGRDVLNVSNLKNAAKAPLLPWNIGDSQLISNLFWFNSAPQAFGFYTYRLKTKSSTYSFPAIRSRKILIKSMFSYLLQK